MLWVGGGATVGRYLEFCFATWVLTTGWHRVLDWMGHWHDPTWLILWTYECIQGPVWKQSWEGHHVGRPHSDLPAAGQKQPSAQRPAHDWPEVDFGHAAWPIFMWIVCGSDHSCYLLLMLPSVLWTDGSMHDAARRWSVQMPADVHSPSGLHLIVPYECLFQVLTD